MTVYLISRTIPEIRMRYSWAPDAAKLLNGVFCIYKPEGISIKRVIGKIRSNLARDLNALPCYKYERLIKDPPEPGTTDLAVSQQEGHVSYLAPSVVTLPSVMEDLSSHRLVLGDRYLPSDFKNTLTGKLQKNSSGVMVIGIGKANWNVMPLIKSARFLSVYHVKGRFGYSTQTGLPDGPLIERTTFHHINKVLVDKVCATIQANHQKHVFEYAGVHIQSQEAYEMACRGLVRPDTEDTPPLMYGVKCIHFNLPDITLEIHAINEDCTYLARIIHELGLKLRSSAVCAQIRRIRLGHFTLDHALLRKDWNLESIIDNIKLCKKLTSRDKLVTDFNIEHSTKKQKLLGNESEPLSSKIKRFPIVSKQEDQPLPLSDTTSNQEASINCRSQEVAEHLVTNPQETLADSTNEVEQKISTERLHV